MAVDLNGDAEALRRLADEKGHGLRSGRAGRVGYRDGLRTGIDDALEKPHEEFEVCPGGIHRGKADRYPAPGRT